MSAKTWKESHSNIMAVAGVSFITLSDEMENILTEGQKQASFLSTAVKKAYNSLVDKIKTAATNEVKVATWELSSKALLSLFDPKDGYVFLKYQIFALLGYFGEPLEEKDIPSAAKPHVVLLQWNLTEGKRTLDKIEKGITELLKLIDKCHGRDLTNLKTELKEIKSKQNTINSDLRVCKMYATTAQKELLEVEKAVVYAIIAVAAEAMIGAYCTGRTATATATTIATTMATAVIVKKISNYAKWLTDFKNDILPKLEMLNQKIKECEERLALNRKESGESAQRG
ncbi:uncharacterized protein [Montipora foliosa]|uniref:uncharacterized protein isoform X3 n=1 Tax=Montipora foliosa TaxID=591990 RepID=UPI0035F1DCAC